MKQPKPNFTQVPNEMIDVWAREFGPFKTAILLQVARSTYGWHKDRDKISDSQLAERTGMSERSVRRLVLELVSAGYLLKKSGHKHSPNEYEIRSPTRIEDPHREETRTEDPGKAALPGHRILTNPDTGSGTKERNKQSTKYTGPDGFPYEWIGPKSRAMSGPTIKYISEFMRSGTVSLEAKDSGGFMRSYKIHLEKGGKTALFS